MRHIVLALMIALLPLRGWVGDVMATEMASTAPRHVQVATEIIADRAHSERAAATFDHLSGDAQAAAMPPDCADHGGTGPTTDMADTSCHSCSACQACHTVALSPLLASTASLSMPPTLPPSPAAQFASAVSALGQKPPIS